MAAIGHPLTVEPLYGGGMAVMLSSYKSDYRKSRRHEERPLIDRLTLHALRITIQHPRGTRAMTVEAPLPKDFRATLTQLGRLLNAPS
jgi:23S rRNA-/tRNA-specific pseudouridylate synthase